MTNFIVAILILLLALSAIVLHKTYYYLPPQELKRRAAADDEVAKQLYKAVAYGGSLGVSLWLIIVLCSGVGFVLLARIAPIWLSLIAVVALLWLGFSWLPKSRVSNFGTRLTLYATPAIAWGLDFLHPLLKRLSSPIVRRTSALTHTGLFERADLLAMIDQQSTQPDNRINEEELQIARRALSFSEQHVSDCLLVADQVKTAVAGDLIGPILIDELHKSGQPLVPVIKSVKKKPLFVGILKTQTLGIGSSGYVRDLMEPTVYYLHEDDSLSEALHAFYVTNCPLFLVVDNNENYVGVITINAILQQLLGHIPGDDYEQYAQPAAIAARHQTLIKPEAKQEDIEKPDETPLEMVE